MDWAKIGQAFSGAAGVYSGGLLDRYQRDKDIEEWKKKAEYSHDLQMDELDARQKEAERVREQEAFRESLKKDIESNPELQPFVERHIQGDEEASRILSVYAGSKYKMSKNAPLSSEEIAELAPLPPGVRHNILQGHLTALRKFADEEAERARKQKADELTDARIKEITQRTAKLEADIANTGEAEAARISIKGLEEETKKRDKAADDIKSLENTILTLTGQLGEKRRQQAQAKKGAKANFNTEVASLAAKLKTAEDQKTRLEGWLRQDASKRIPGIGPEPEAPKPAADAISDETQKFINSLPEGDRTDLYTLIKSRRDLTQEQCVQVFQLFKADEQRKKLNEQQALRIK